MGISLPMYFVVLSPNVVCGTLYVLNVVTVLSTFLTFSKCFTCYYLSQGGGCAIRSASQFISFCTS